MEKSKGLSAEPSSGSQAQLFLDSRWEAMSTMVDGAQTGSRAGLSVNCSFDLDLRQVT